jgi:hypothetical protein
MALVRLDGAQVKRNASDGRVTNQYGSLPRMIFRFEIEYGRWQFAEPGR